jgi:glycosyltransferase involved in cell wall biosynthesis
MIQDGARRQYLVPLGLQGAGILERVYIDWFVRRGSPQEMLARVVSGIKPKLGRKMLERSCPELDPRRVVSNTPMALRLRARMSKFAKSEDAYMWHSRQTAKWVERRGFGEANVLYGFIRNAAPEVYRAAKARGLRTAGDQIIAPLEVEVAEMKRQLERWPGWNDREAVELHPEYARFERETWEVLDRITCMSPYVREGLEAVGVPAGKIEVIPYPSAISPRGYVPRTRKNGPLVVGFVGAVGLRKGAPWFLEVARRFDPVRVRFVMVGSIMIDGSKLEPYAGRVEMVGGVPRSEAREWMRRFDVFFFPSTCEGSAGAVMQAMEAGLAVLTTHNSGSRVRDGVDGFIRKYDDVEGFKEAIERLDEDRDLLVRMGESARQRVLDYGMTAYQKDLGNFFGRLVNPEGGGSYSESRGAGKEA